MGTETNGGRRLPDDVPPPAAAPEEPAPPQSRIRRWPDAARALADGRPAEAHAVLRRRLGESPPAAERAALIAILADPRTFATPAKAPKLGRLNGVGVGMYGGSAVDPADGSYVKTRWFSVFWVPVFPIDQWIVQDAEDGGGWYFHAKVPLDLSIRRMRAVAVAVLALVAVVVAGTIVWNARHAELQLLNGLDVPAEVTVGDEPPIVVGPNSRQSVRVAAGPLKFRCSVNGRVVDERTETVKGGTDLVAYNVAGSAPMCVVDVIYTTEAYQAGKGPNSGVSVLAGTVFVQRGGVDDVFRSSPDSVSMRSSEKTRRRRRAEVLDGGWRTSLEVVEEEVGGKPAADLGERLALAVPRNSDVVAAALLLSAKHREPAVHADFLARLETARAAASK